MKRIVWLGLFLLIILSGTGATATYEFEPSPADLYGLDHYRNYTWGIGWRAPQGEVITGASLKFDNIRNWRTEPNDLWVHLLDNLPVGVTQEWDWREGGDDFAGRGILLHHWQNLSATAHDIVYLFSALEVGILNEYSADALWGAAFDPDCHFYNDGIKLTIETAKAPAPTTILLFGTGLLFLVALKRRSDHP
jgi:hypothetical protein